jgi:hypothetical protein
MALSVSGERKNTQVNRQEEAKKRNEEHVLVIAFAKEFLTARYCSIDLRHNLM